MWKSVSRWRQGISEMGCLQPLSLPPVPRALPRRILADIFDSAIGSRSKLLEWFHGSPFRQRSVWADTAADLPSALRPDCASDRVADFSWVIAIACEAFGASWARFAKRGRQPGASISLLAGDCPPASPYPRCASPATGRRTALGCPDRPRRQTAQGNPTVPGHPAPRRMPQPGPGGCGSDRQGRIGNVRWADREAAGGGAPAGGPGRGGGGAARGPAGGVRAGSPGGFAGFGGLHACPRGQRRRRGPARAGGGPAARTCGRRRIRWPPGNWPPP